MNEHSTQQKPFYPECSIYISIPVINLDINGLFLISSFHPKMIVSSFTAESSSEKQPYGEEDCSTLKLCSSCTASFHPIWTPLTSIAWGLKITGLLDFCFLLTAPWAFWLFSSFWLYSFWSNSKKSPLIWESQLQILADAAKGNLMSALHDCLNANLCCVVDWLRHIHCAKYHTPIHTHSRAHTHIRHNTLP